MIDWDLRTKKWQSNGLGWLWLVGSFKIQVSFAEYNLLYRALLQKRPMFLGSLLIVATPCHDIRITCWGDVDSPNLMRVGWLQVSSKHGDIIQTWWYHPNMMIFKKLLVKLKSCRDIANKLIVYAINSSYMRVMSWHRIYDEFIVVTSHTRWVYCMRDVTYSHRRHDACVCVTWLIHMYDMTHLHVRHVPGLLGSDS